MILRKLFIYSLTKTSESREKDRQGEIKEEKIKKGKKGKGREGKEREVLNGHKYCEEN
jgi:hypothetical protein